MRTTEPAISEVLGTHLAELIVLLSRHLRARHGASAKTSGLVFNNKVSSVAWSSSVGQVGASDRGRSLHVLWLRDAIWGFR